MEKEEKYVSICPVCGSLDIRADNSSPGFVGYGAPLRSICCSCGYSAYVFPEVPESKIEEFRKNVKKE